MQERRRRLLDSVSSDSEEMLGHILLLALDGSSALLVLIRHHRPLHCMAKFQLFSWPIGLSQLGLQSIIGWDFTSVVVHREKWEGLAWGPDLAYGRSTLVIVSDDNFSLV